MGSRQQLFLGEWFFRNQFCPLPLKTPFISVIPLGKKIGNSGDYRVKNYPVGIYAIRFSPVILSGPENPLEHSLGFPNMKIGSLPHRGGAFFPHVSSFIPRYQKPNI
jgi:hypothetical protein